MNKEKIIPVTGFSTNCSWSCNWCNL